MLERFGKEPKLPERVGVLHEQLTGGEPELLEHRLSGVELRHTISQESGEYGHPSPILGNERDVQRAHLFGGAARHVEQGKGFLEATTMCLQDPEVRRRLE